MTLAAAERCLASALAAMAPPAAAVLPRVSLAATVESATSPQGIAASRNGKALLGIFDEAGLPGTLGFNIASREVTVTARLAAVEAELASGGGDGGAEWSPAKTLVWTMLGVHPRQAELEQLYQQQQQQQQQQPRAEGAGAQQPSAALANGCLLAFSKAVHVGVVKKKVHLRLGTVTVALEPTRKGMRNPKGQECADSKAVLFQYAPAYLALSGFDPATKAYSQAALAAAVDEFGATFVAAFWAEMERARYVATEALKDAVSADLLRYGKSAAAAGVYGDQSVRFTPTQPLSLYLWGAAGAGKSAFVTALAAALQTAVCAHLNPAEKVDIVKIPLNSMPPEVLRSELYVRGISDWSVERMVEQAISRGNTVILHLEENPEAPELQAELAEMVYMVVDRVRARYRKAAHKIVPLWTANYPPLVPAVLDTATVVSMAALLAGHQQRMCELKVRHSIVTQLEGPAAARPPRGEEPLVAAAGARDIDVRLEVMPPVSSDLRPVEKWIASIAFYAAACHRQLAAKQGAPGAKRHRRHESIDSGINSGSDGGGSGSGSDGGSGSGSEADGEADGAPGGRAVARVSGDHGARRYTVSVEHYGQTASIELESADGFFYYPHSHPAPGAAASDPDPASDPAAARRRSQLEAVAGMLESGTLTPAVLVLQGSREACGQVQREVAAFMAGKYGSSLHEKEVAIRSAADDEAVLGTRWDFPRGGLFKFIDDVNNAAGEHRRESPGFSMITARVNGHGQYVLREPFNFTPMGGQSDFVWLSARTPPWGCTVRVVSQTKSRKIPTRNMLPLFFAL